MESITEMMSSKLAALKNIFSIPSRSESMAGVIILYVFTNSVATSVWMFNAWSPFIFTLFNGSNVYVGLMSAINGFFELSTAFFSGHVADTKWGPSKTLTHAVHFGLVTLCVVLIGVWSGKLWMLILAQCFEGTYMGFSFTCLESVFAQCLRRGERDRLYSVKFSCEAAGPIVGLILSIILYAGVGNVWNVKVLRWVMTAGIALHLGSMLTFLSHFKPLPWQPQPRSKISNVTIQNDCTTGQDTTHASDFDSADGRRANVKSNNSAATSHQTHKKHTYENSEMIKIIKTENSAEVNIKGSMSENYKGKVYTATDVIVLDEESSTCNQPNIKSSLHKNNNDACNTANITSFHNPCAKLACEPKENNIINNNNTNTNTNNYNNYKTTNNIITGKDVWEGHHNNNQLFCTNQRYEVEEQRASTICVENEICINANEDEGLELENSKDVYLHNSIDNDNNNSSTKGIRETVEVVNRARAAVWCACGGGVVSPALIMSGAHAQPLCTAAERTREERAEDEAILRSSFVGLTSHTRTTTHHPSSSAELEFENNDDGNDNNHHNTSHCTSTLEFTKESTLSHAPLTSHSLHGTALYDQKALSVEHREEQVDSVEETIQHVSEKEAVEKKDLTVHEEEFTNTNINNINDTKNSNNNYSNNDTHENCLQNGQDICNRSAKDNDIASANNINNHDSLNDHDSTNEEDVYEVDVELQKARGFRRAIMKCIPLDWYPVIVVVCDLVLVLGSGMTTQYFALFMMKLYDVSPVMLSFLGLANALLIAFLAIVNGFVGQRWGRVRAMVPLKLMGSFILLWMALARGTVYGPKFLMCIAYVVRNAFMNCSSGLSRALLMDLVPENKRGRWNAIESVQSAGWSGTAFLGGFLADSFGYGAAFIFTFFFHITACMMLLPLTARNDARLPILVHVQNNHDNQHEHDEVKLPYRTHDVVTVDNDCK